MAKSFTKDLRAGKPSSSAADRRQLYHDNSWSGGDEPTGRRMAYFQRTSSNGAPPATNGLNSW